MTAHVLTFLRYLVAAAVGVAAAAALLAMAVDTRRINPFGRTGRIVRALTDPPLRPIERRLTRTRLDPRYAPWWLIGIAIFSGILVLTLAGWLAVQAYTLRVAAEHGLRGLLAVVLDWTFGLLGLALIVRIIGSWVGASRFTPWMRPFVLATEWLLAPLRGVVPSFAMFDLTPLVAWLLLQVVRYLLLSAL